MFMQSAARMLSNAFTFTGHNDISNRESICCVGVRLQIFCTFVHISLKLIPGSTENLVCAKRTDLFGHRLRDRSVLRFTSDAKSMATPVHHP
jgi:hypothetical protein